MQTSSEITVVWSDEETGAKVEALKELEKHYINDDE